MSAAIASKSDLARSLFDAYQRKDRTLAERLLAGDFTFTSPYDDAIDRAEYFVRCWPTSEFFKAFEFEKIAEQGDDAFVNYKANTKDGEEFRNVEVLILKGGQIRAVNVYFGATYKDGKFVKQAETP
jgi:ketosteroid isomerase-like protein